MITPHFHLVAQQPPIQVPDNHYPPTHDPPSTHQSTSKKRNRTDDETEQRNSKKNKIINLKEKNPKLVPKQQLQNIPDMLRSQMRRRKVPVQRKEHQSPSPPTTSTTTAGSPRTLPGTSSSPQTGPPHRRPPAPGSTPETPRALPGTSSLTTDPDPPLPCHHPPITNRREPSKSFGWYSIINRSTIKSSIILTTLSSPPSNESEASASPNSIAET